MGADDLLVLVTDERGERAINAVDGLRALIYDRWTATLPPGAADAEVIVVDADAAPTTRQLIPQLPRLRLVQALTAGTELWEGNVPSGVALTNARGAHGRSTAEWAVAALLAIYRELIPFAALQARRIWDQHVTETLDTARVLVLGAGDLGQHTAAMLGPFGARVTLVGRTARPGVHGVAELPVLLPEQDAVIVVLPHTPSTHQIVDAAFLALMPDRAVLVNGGRGALVDTAALLAELERGRLRAALDVTDPEPLPAEHPLWTAPNVLITPHVGGATEGFPARAWAVAAEQVAVFARGERPPNLVG